MTLQFPINLNSDLEEILYSAFLHRNDSHRYKVLVHHLGNHFLFKIKDQDEETIIYMLNLLIDNIIVAVGGTVFQRNIGNHMGIYCTLYLTVFL